MRQVLYKIIVVGCNSNTRQQYFSKNGSNEPAKKRPQLVRINNQILPHSYRSTFSVIHHHTAAIAYIRHTFHTLWKTWSWNFLQLVLTSTFFQLVLKYMMPVWCNLPIYGVEKQIKKPDAILSATFYNCRRLPRILSCCVLFVQLY